MRIKIKFLNNFSTRFYFDKILRSALKRLIDKKLLSFKSVSYVVKFSFNLDVEKRMDILMK